MGEASKPPGGLFMDLGLKIRVRFQQVSEAARGGIEEFMSRQSYLMKGAWPWDAFYLGLDHNALMVQWFGSKYLWTLFGLCNSPDK